MKRLFALICLLHAATLGAMERESFTFDANATKEYYTPGPNKHVITSFDEYDFVIAVQESARTQSDREPFLGEKQIRIDIENLAKEQRCTKNQRNYIDVKTADKQPRTIKLFFDNDKDYNTLIERVKTQVETVNFNKQREQAEQEKRDLELAKIKFYNRLKLGVLGVSFIGFGAYLAYKQPSWFMNGVMNFAKNLFSFRFSR